MNTVERLGKKVADSIGEGPSAERLGAQRHAALQATVSRRSRRRTFIVAIPAGAALAGALIVLLQPWKSPIEFWINDAVTPADEGAVLNESTSTRFADGSLVELQQESRARVLRASNNRVTLKLEHGRSQLRVSPRTPVEWRVRAGPFSIGVAGTLFDCGWEPEASRLTVDVQRGEVHVTGPRWQDGIRVLSGERLEVERDRFEVRSTTQEAETQIEPDDQVTDGEARPPVRTKRQPTAHPSWKTLAERTKWQQSLTAARQHGFAKLLGSLPLEDLSLLADVARFAKSPPHAHQALAAIERRFPHSTAAARVPFLAGRISIELEQSSKKAVRLFDRYLDASPDGELAVEARGRLLQALLQTGERARAKEVAQDYMARHPRGPHAALAREVLATKE